MPDFLSFAARCCAVSTLALLGACAGAPPAPAPVRPAAVAAPLPAATAVAAPAAEPAPLPAVVVTPATQQQAQKQAQAAVELLEHGKPDAARAELEQALQNDPANRLAQNLMRQITADPAELLGREAFNYTVRPGDSLSRIAQRFLNDVYGFYILARYNDIQVPRQVASGQVLRIPGKAPPAGALVAVPAPLPAPLPAAGSATQAAAVLPLPPAPAPAPAPASADTQEQARRAQQQQIAVHLRQARSAFARQDLDGAIAQWDRVLALDPDHAAALRERQRALALKDKLQAVR